MIFGQIKMIITVIMIAGIAGAGIYVTKLRSDNAILKANQIQLEQSIESQKAVLEQAKEDYKSILEANKKMNETNNILKAEYRALDKRFNKNGRDLGYLATKRTKAVEKIINRASVNAQRCVEIAMGSPLTEKELNATKKSEINSECPSLANPKFVTH